MVKLSTKIKYVLTAAVLFLLAAIGTLCNGAINAHAAVSTPSYVLEDLGKDRNFNVADYPIIENDYSLKVIQIAESTDGELLIYVYQPSGAIKSYCATTIRLSQTSGINVAPKDYDLTYLNSVGVFFKYKVENLQLRTEPVRYYDITAIHRPFDKVSDDGANGGNTVNDVVFDVAQLWTATTVNGKVSYELKDVEIIKTTNKYVGFTQYNDGTQVGWGIVSGWTRAHFVAFSTGHKIDKLLSADVAFKEQDVNCKLCGNALHVWHEQGKCYDYEYSDPYQHTPNPLTIHYSDKGAGGGYTWNRIRSTADWLADENNKDYLITDDGAENITGTQWVLNFYETQIQAKIDGMWLNLLSPLALPFTGDADVKYKRVSYVTILRLSFETDNKIYNLGVVDNKQTGNNKPINTPIDDGKFAGLPIWAWIIIIVAVVIVIVLILICVFVPGAAPAIGKGLLVVGKGILFGIYYLFYGLFWIISAPFRLIANAVKNRKRAPTKSGKSKGGKRK